MNKQLYIIVLLLVLVYQLSAQQVEKTYTGTFLLKDGRVETVYKGVIEADVLISDGIVQEVAADIGHPGAQLIDCKGLIIYPGMIDSGTKLGLGEIGAVSLTQDHN